MLKLITFGGLAVEDDSAPVSGAAMQRSRLALLAVLAAAGAKGCRRDKLIAYLWTDTDPERARHALKQAVYALRRDLHSEVIVNSGADDLRLNADVITSDVAEFRDALARAAPNDAVAAYRGRFLDGVNVRDAPEFERWASAERDALERDYCRALQQVATAATARGDHDAAVTAWRRATTVDPLSATTAIELMRALVASGDTAAALQHARIYETLVRHELGAPADPAVMALAAELRKAPGTIDRPAPRQAHVAQTDPDTTVAPVSLPPVVHTMPVETVSSATPADDPRLVSRGRPRRSWLPALAVIGAGVMVASALVARSTGRDDVRPIPRRVLVMPFTNHTGSESLASLSTMSADWITQGIEETGLVEIVDPHTVAAATTHGSARDDRAIARAAGAGTIVSGSYYALGDSVELRANVVDVGSNIILRVVAPVRAPGSHVEDGVDVLRQRVMTAFATLFDQRFGKWAVPSGQPPLYEAYRDYVDGMDAFNRMAFDDALAEFLQAHDRDTTFVLPLGWAARIYLDRNDLRHADSLARIAARSRSRLAPFERHGLDWLQANVAGDLNGALRAARIMAEIAPGTDWADYVWANQALTVNRPHEALRALARVDADQGVIRPSYPYWNAITAAYHFIGDHDSEARRAMQAQHELPGGISTLLYEVRAFAAAGDVVRLRAVLAQSEQMPRDAMTDPDDVALVAAEELGAHGQTNERDRILSTLLSSPGHSRAVRARALYLAHRWDEAARQYQALVESDSSNVDYLGQLGVAQAGRGDSLAAAAIASRLEQWERRPYTVGRATYWRACIASESGQDAEAVRLLALAFTQGQEMTLQLHSEPAIARLASFGPFRALIAPKG